MLDEAQAWEILNTAERICSAVVISEALARLGDEITADLSHTRPLVLSVMGGAVVFCGQILPLLKFPLELDYIHATRYGKNLAGQEVDWRVLPGSHVAGRTVLVLDDILDEGRTLAAVCEKVRALGAADVRCAVFAEKQTNRVKPLCADYVGLHLPDRFVFGFGMDVSGWWRNLPEIYALTKAID